MEFESISKLERLLSTKCKIEKIYPSVFASDTETNIVTVEVKCPDGQIHKIRAYRDEASALREFIRNRGL
jgi:acetone carboxylase gamma subunit